MTAQEKFESRIKANGLWDEWCKQGCYGRVGKETNDGIIIFCNEGEDDDVYSEHHYPHISAMQESDDFRLRALREFCYHDDDSFIRKLAYWVADFTYECPLFPVDVFFLYDDADVICFKDDSDEIMDCSNNHSPRLVAAINTAYRNKQEDLIKIVRTLAERDNEETILAKLNPYDMCHEYCQFVADNHDLETILCYCRMYA